jgi:branched-chain amino acid transport system permease protein
MIPQLLANGIVSGCVYALIALGFGLIYNTTRIFHLAHGVIYTATSYFFYLLFRMIGFNLYLGFSISLALCMLFGTLMELFVYYPLYRRKASPGVILISSLGIYIFIVNLIAMLFGNETKILSPGISKTYHVGSVILTRIQLMELFAFVLLFPLYLLLLRRTGIGRIIRALADNPLLITVLGVDIRKIRIFVFAFGSLLAGIAANLVALDVGMDPNVGLEAFLIAAVAVIIGGVGNFNGAAVGALLLGVLQNLMVWKISARWTDTLVFAVLILFLLFRPQGILGGRRRLEEA